MKIGFIGAGQMAQAFAKGIVDANLVAAADVIASDCSTEARSAFQKQIPSSKLCDDNGKIVGASDVIVLAVKPQFVTTVAAQIDTIPDDKLLVSIAAGITIAQLTELFGTNRVVRVMPNTPCLIRKGAAGFSSGPGASADDAATVERLLSSLGISFQLDEHLLDAVTGLSGSGPAYVYVFIEALSDAGVRVGLPRSVASKLAAQTVYGGAAMVLESGEHPATLKDRVASPAGTTIAGLHQLESGAFRGTIYDAVVKATQRSIDLGKGSIDLGKAT